MHGSLAIVTAVVLYCSFLWGGMEQIIRGKGVTTREKLQTAHCIVDLGPRLAKQSEQRTARKSSIHHHDEQTTEVSLLV